VSPGSILILLRSDRNGVFSTPIRGALEAAGILAVHESQPLAALDEGQPGRQVLAVLRLVQNRLDSLAWHTLLRERPNGIGAETIRRIYELARLRGATFGEVLPDAPGSVGSRGGALMEELHAIGGILNAVGAPSEGPPLQAWLNGAVDQVVVDAAERIPITRAFDRLRAGEESQTLEQLLRALGASLGEGEQEASREGAVALMTMHQAKGLTAEAVIVVGCEDEYIPGRAEGGAEIDDARRLLYVSMTRARRFLLMTHCRERVGAQRHTGSRAGQVTRRLSPFLEGLPDVPSRAWAPGDFA
jgi:DNA helicase-2/ATP-dependent DNA helicase PcrA